MPTEVINAADIKPGDLYEDSLRHPCLCVNKTGSEISGISLVDGSYPRSDDVSHTPLRRLSIEESWYWRLNGPRDTQLSQQQRWWEKKPSYMINPAHYLENLYFFSLYQVEWNEEALKRLGSPIKHEWHDIKSNIVDQGHAGTVKISFRICGAEREGQVHVEAHKTTNDWLFDELFLEVADEQKRLVIIQNGIDVTR